MGKGLYALIVLRALSGLNGTKACVYMYGSG